MPIHSHQYELSLAFDTDHPEFVRGFEAGRVWEALHHGDEGHAFTVHTSNAEMMLRMGEATERGGSSVEHDDQWMTVVFE